MRTSSSRGGVEIGTAEVNGARLYYELLGDGPPLVLLHGFTLDHRMWKHQVDELARSHRVLTYDARGFGRSSLPTNEPYQHCADAAALCEYLGLKGVVAIGHSIGAHQMLELALSRPDLVAGWVPICMSGLTTVPFSEDLTSMFAAIRQAAREHGIDAAKKIWRGADWFAPARKVPALAAELDGMLDDYSGWHWTHDNPAKSLEPPAAEALPNLRTPVLVVTGAGDIPYTQAVREALMSRLQSPGVLHLPHASHMANMEDPAAVNQAIAAFARRVG